MQLQLSRFEKYHPFPTQRKSGQNLLLRWHVCRRKFARMIFFELRNFSGKMLRNFLESFEPFENIPQNSHRISHKIYPQKIKKNPWRASCRRAAQEELIEVFWYILLSSYQGSGKTPLPALGKGAPTGTALLPKWISVEFLGASRRNFW